MFGGSFPSRRHLLPALLAVAAIGLGLLFWLSDDAARWTWVRLGFAWIPSLLWPIAFLLALRYRTRWLTQFWRLWVGSAIFALGSVGLLSLFSPDRWGLDDPTLGGHWGQVLGGSPFSHKYLGILKVVFLFAVVPPIISPHWAGGAYKQGAKDMLLGARGLSLWLRHSGLPALGWALSRIPLPAKNTRHRIALRFRVARRRVARHFWGEPAIEEMAEPESASASQAEVEAELGDAAAELVEPEHSSEAPSRKQEREPAAKKAQASRQIFGWHLPPADLLDKLEPRSATQAAPAHMSEQIVSALGEHGLEVSVKDVRIGPRVIRFGLVPGWMPRGRDSKGVRPKQQGGLPTSDSVRVKVQSILAREKDLALVLKTPHIRIEAPVPGEAIVGLEVPNPFPNKVPIRSVIESPNFRKMAAKGGLPVALGEDTGGDPVVVDLLGLPHLLIAGATGSGKSVCINTVITSLLLTNPPDRLRFLMVDPKRVELTPFNGIPHLVAPVIVDPDEVLGALKGIVSEMFRRYRAMEEMGVRDIEGYNRKIREHMPYLIVVIDELADMMMVAAYESEQAAVRLAQLGRATGVHLVLATQRPSVNVVTGLIKANIPARAAFAVASQVDSRVVLDGVGAERLLGKGDMLFLSQDSPKPRRVQGALVQDEEVERVVEFWKAQKGPALPSIMLTNGESEPESPVHRDDGDYDELLDRARELAEELPRVSPSVLQRRLQIGYSKAVQLIKSLEEEGVTAGRTG